MNPRSAPWLALALMLVAQARAEAPMITVPIRPSPAVKTESVIKSEVPSFRFEPPPVDYTPATGMERILEDRLVRVEDGVALRVPPVRLTGVKFYAIYFSAGWNVPSRKFTEKLVQDYPKLRELYPEFELVMVSRDQSRPAMVTSMYIEQMPWLAIRWDLNAGTREITRYGRGVPCLVLVDAEGAVLADIYRDGNFVGPEGVLQQIWKTLYEYRRGHPLTVAQSKR